MGSKNLDNPLACKKSNVGTANLQILSMNLRKSSGILSVTLYIFLEECSSPLLCDCFCITTCFFTKLLATISGLLQSRVLERHGTRLCFQTSDYTEFENFTKWLDVTSN